MMRRLALLLLLVLTAPAAAQEHVVVGLSEESVSITANFKGTEILVFGAIRRDAPPVTEPPLDVIVTVEGPRQAVEVRQKSRVAGIWINTERASIDIAPSFYAVAGTRPVGDALSAEDDRRFRVSVPSRVGLTTVMPGIEEPARFAEALIRLRSGSGFYREEEEPVDLAEDTLFATSFVLPANLIEGDYEVRIFLARGGRVIDAYSTLIDVRKVGLEQFLYTLAHARPALYGLLSLLIAVVAGWAAAAFFRLLRN